MAVTLITILHIIVCVFLIAVVLLQSGKSADIAAAFGGMGSQTAFGTRTAATVLSQSHDLGGHRVHAHLDHAFCVLLATRSAQRIGAGRNQFRARQVGAGIATGRAEEVSLTYDTVPWPPLVAEAFSRAQQRRA